MSTEISVSKSSGPPPAAGGAFNPFTEHVKASFGDSEWRETTAMPNDDVKPVVDLLRRAGVACGIGVTVRKSQPDAETTIVHFLGREVRTRNAS